MFIAAQNLQKSYGLHVILDNISFVINEKECIGLVGPNGAGKSTLIRILAGEEEKESGTLSFATNLQVGYLPQTTPPFYGLSIQDLIQEAMGGLKQLEERIHKLEQLMSTASAIEIQPLLEEYQQTTTLFQDRGGYDLDYKINEVLAGLRLNYLPRQQAVEDLSGGEKARVHLAILLLRSPDLLLLDEPTNHLDFESMAWLESFLHNYTGSILIVSHDRQFLNRTVNTILELDHDSHQLKRYTGNYDAYMSAKVAERKQWEEDYLRQQEEIQDLRKRIKTTGRAIGHTNRKPRDNDKFAPYFFAQNVQKAVSSNIRAAQAQLERIEADPVPEPPDLLSISTHFQSEPLPSSLALTIRHLHKRFGERVILDDLNLELSSRSRILLVGPNGTGKTTLLKMITGAEKPDSGEIRLAPGIEPGYLQQEPVFPDLDKTVIETYRYQQQGYEGEFIGRLLGYGLFRLEDMEKKVRYLSMGQRRKLEIACLMAARPNLLLLDEPTNYISLDMLEAFEQALHEYQGPILAISHDRWFIEHFQGEIWTIEAGQIKQKKDFAVTL